MKPTKIVQNKIDPDGHKYTITRYELDSEEGVKSNDYEEIKPNEQDKYLEQEDAKKAAKNSIEKESKNHTSGFWQKKFSPTEKKRFPTREERLERGESFPKPLHSELYPEKRALINPVDKNNKPSSRER